MSVLAFRAAPVAAVLLAALAAVPVAPLAAQSPNVGDVAPAFSLPGATADGVRKTPVTLADFRGQTVVVAFFPKARTSGCTHQMEAYRDRYASLFHGGKKVTLIAVSADADTTLYAWARDEKFPFVMASDKGGAIGTLYGVYNPTPGYESRVLFIVGPDGKITYRAQPFRELVETSYTDLGTALDHTIGGQ
jgi:thioredoxin-dependent peroxiredoxin